MTWNFLEFTNYSDKGQEKSLYWDGLVKSLKHNLNLVEESGGGALLLKCSIFFDNIQFDFIYRNNYSCSPILLFFRNGSTKCFLVLLESIDNIHRNNTRPVLLFLHNLFFKFVFSFSCFNSRHVP